MRSIFKIAGIFVLIICSITMGHAQIRFDRTTHDFGKLSNWSQSPAVFAYENVGNQPEAFLNAVRSSNVHIKYTTRFIQPGEKGEVLIYFEPLTIGPFSTKVKLYVGSSPDPIVFSISGRVTSYLECPSVNIPADPSMLIHEQQGLVIDSETKEAIPSAHLKFVSGEGDKQTAKTNKEGRFRKKLKLGMYQILINAEGYHSLEEMLYLNKNTGELVFELNPVSIIEEDTLEKEPLLAEEIQEITGDVPEPDVEPDEGKNSLVEDEEKEKLEAVNIRGIILNSLTNDPVARASIRLLNEETGVPYTYKTFKDGKYFKKLYPGKYKVSIQAPDYYPYEEDILITSETDYLEFKLKPEKLNIIEADEDQRERIIVGGTVYNRENREPVKRANIILKDDNGVPYTYLTMKDGKYQKTLIPGTYYVEITAEGYVPFSDTIQIEYPTHDLDFAMEKIFIEEKPIALIEEETEEIEIREEEDIEPAEGIELHPKKYAANNIVFLVDVSSSMRKKNKLENLKISMKRLTEVLRGIDQLTLISYASSPVTVFTELPADEKDTIYKSIDSLKAGGLTHGVKGLERAYIFAELNFVEGGNNQVIIATDGEFNSPNHSELELIALITKYRQKGIITSVIGFGKDEKGIRRMKRIAALGNGNYIHIEDAQQAQSVLIEEIKANSIREENQ
jgi:Mg-chelatase subunit ChlD